MVISTLFICVCVLSCTPQFGHGKGGEQDSCDCYSSSILYNVPVQFNNKVPGDLEAFNNQSQADCFAWQEFVTLNWSMDQSHGFGDPGDLTPVQWETFMPRDVMFQPNGVAPPAWGTLVSEKYAEKFKTQRLLLKPGQTKLLTFTSKFDGADTLNNLDFGQAAPFNSPNWLGAQNATNVWYEIMLNKDYYDFLLKKTRLEAIKECVKLKDTITLLASINKKYEEALLEMNCKITKHTDSLENISLEGSSVVSYTTISFPDYRFVYKEDGLKIQDIIEEALSYSNNVMKDFE